MASNTVVAKQELVEVNDKLYGSARLAMSIPLVMQIAGQEKNLSDGTLKNQTVKKIIYDLVQKFPETDLAKLFTSQSTEKSQANLKSAVFNYIRKALIVEIQYSNLESGVDKTQPQARLIQEMFKQFDYASYYGMWGNQGVVNNSKLEVLAPQSGKTLSEITAAVRNGFKKLVAIGWNNKMMNQVSIGMTQSISTQLSNFGEGRSKSDLKIFEEEFEGANFLILPDYLERGDRVELYLRPLITHHHASLPSLYNDYDSPDGLTNFNMFSFETSALELEEQGVITSIPLDIS